LIEHRETTDWGRDLKSDGKVSMRKRKKKKID